MEKFLQHLEFVEAQSNEVTRHFTKVQMNKVPYAYLELILRVKAAAKGLKRLVSDVENDPDLEFSAGLIIRTILLDFFISLRGFDIADRARQEGKPDEEVKAEIEAFFNTILGDGLELTGRHFARMARQGFIDEAGLHERLNNLTVRYSSFLKPYTGDKKVDPIYPPAPKNHELFDRICERPELKNLAQEFDAYGLYSKYEHFNIMSYDVFRRDHEAQAQTMQDKIKLLLLHLNQMISMLRFYFDDEFLIEKHSMIQLYTFKEVFDMSDEQIKAHVDAA